MPFSRISRSYKHFEWLRSAWGKMFPSNFDIYFSFILQSPSTMRIINELWIMDQYVKWNDRKKNGWNVFWAIFKLIRNGIRFQAWLLGWMSIDIFELCVFRSNVSIRYEKYQISSRPIQFYNRFGWQKITSSLHWFAVCHSGAESVPNRKNKKIELKFYDMSNHFLRLWSLWETTQKLLKSLSFLTGI